MQREKAHFHSMKCLSKKYVVQAIYFGSCRPLCVCFCFSVLADFDLKTRRHCFMLMFHSSSQLHSAIPVVF